MHGLGLLAVAGGSEPRPQGERVGVRKCLTKGGVQVGGDVPRFLRLEGSRKDGYASASARSPDAGRWAATR